MQKKKESTKWCSERTLIIVYPSVCWLSLIINTQILKIEMTTITITLGNVSHQHNWHQVHMIIISPFHDTPRPVFNIYMLQKTKQKNTQLLHREETQWGASALESSGTTDRTARVKTSINCSLLHKSACLCLTGCNVSAGSLWPFKAKGRQIEERTP